METCDGNGADGLEWAEASQATTLGCVPTADSQYSMPTPHVPAPRPVLPCLSADSDLPGQPLGSAGGQRSRGGSQFSQLERCSRLGAPPWLAEFCWGAVAGHWSLSDSAQPALPPEAARSPAALSAATTLFPLPLQSLLAEEAIPLSDLLERVCPQLPAGVGQVRSGSSTLWAAGCSKSDAEWIWQTCPGWGLRQTRSFSVHTITTAVQTASSAGGGGGPAAGGRPAALRALPLTHR